MSANPTDLPSSAFAGLPRAAGRGDGVIVTERDGLGIARVTARRGEAAHVARLLQGNLGIEPPSGPRRSSRGEVAIAGIGPQTWLVTHETGGNTFARHVQSLLDDRASVADQSDAYVMLRLAGPRVRATLAKLVPVDVHGRSFEVGGVAQTLCGYMSVMLWRLEDSGEGPVFEIWGARSLAVSLHQAICHGAAEFGFLRRGGLE